MRAAVADSLAGAATEGVAAVQVATGPLLFRLTGVAEQAREGDAALRAGWHSRQSISHSLEWLGQSRPKYKRLPALKVFPGGHSN